MARDIFTPIPTPARREVMARFEAFLLDRDGVPDLMARVLPRREEMIRRFNNPPATFAGRIDQAMLDTQCARYDGSRSLSKEVGLLLAYVKINAAEAWSVEKNLQWLASQGGTPVDGIPLFRLLEEDYHTKILLSAANVFGVRATARYDPSPGMDLLLKAIVNLPAGIGDPLGLATEFYSVMCFNRLLRRTREILGDEPVLRELFEERVTEVLIDEIGHVSFYRMLLGSSGLRLASALLPLVAVGLRGAIPEAERAGVMPVPWDELFTFELRDIPDEIRARAFVC
jgi:hypothetical protein